MENRKKEIADLPKAEVRKHRRHRISLIWLVPLFAALAAGWLVYESVRKAGPTIRILFVDGSGLHANQTELRYRGVHVGDVTDVKLTEDQQNVEVTARLDQSAAGLAREGSLFWVVRPELNAGGLSGLETIVSGSYIQVQPGKGKEQNKFTGVEHGPAIQSSEDGLEIILIATDAGSLVSGSTIYYRGLEVGAVRYVELGDDGKTIRVNAQIQSRYASLVHINSRFWNAGGINVNLRFFAIDVSAESLKALLGGGIAFSTPSPPGNAVTNGAIFPLYDKP